MEYEQLDLTLARALCRDLKAALAPSRPAAEVSIRECGVNSSCAARRGDALCNVYCFHYDTADRKGPEYQVCFFCGEQVESSGRTPLSSGRTPSSDEAVGAVCDWLAGTGIQVLHDSYAFVDRHKRALASLAASVLAASPELRQSVSHELKDRGWDDCELAFSGGDRSCYLSFYGDSPVPNALFRWDQTPMFGFAAGDAATLAAVLRRWLCDRLAPSGMREEFCWITLSAVAAYYEAGRAVEGEFILSWDGIERWYSDPQFPVSAAALRLIAQMRAAGYDRKLRAGQSMFSLGLSRSRRHGLRRGQPCIWFTWKQVGMEVEARLGAVTKLRVPKVELTPELDALVKQLSEMPID